MFGLTLTLCCVVAGDTNDPSSYNKEIRLNPTKVETYIDRGSAYMRKRDWKEAIKDFSEAVRLSPNNALPCEWRGGAYFMNDDLDKAINDFSQAIRLNPTNAATFSNRGSVYRAKGEFGKAISDFSECLKFNPTDSNAYGSRASAYLTKGDFGKATSDCTEYLRLKPNDATVLLMRARSQEKGNQFDEAIRDYRDAIRLDPKNLEAINGLAWLRSTCREPAIRNGKEAVETATKACELSNWKVWHYIDTLAAAYAEVGNFEKAIAYQKEALDLDVDKADRKCMQQRLEQYEQREPHREGQKP